MLLLETALPIKNNSFGDTIQGSGDMNSSSGDVKLGNAIGNDANFNFLSTIDLQWTRWVNEVYNNQMAL